MRLALICCLCATAAFGQHDISKVAPVKPGEAVATPLDAKQRTLKKYDFPVLEGAQQVLGSQLIDGRLRKPLVDYQAAEGEIQQRLSIFEGGLVVVQMTGAATLRKRVLIPEDAVAIYLKATNASSLSRIAQRELPPAEPKRRAQLRVYSDDGIFVERFFHPGAVLPKEMNDQIAPLRDLLRAVSEDREVTSSVTGYQPKPGDELVADDHKVYRVTRVIENIVEMRCANPPITIYVAKDSLHLYFIGRRAEE